MSDIRTRVHQDFGERTTTFVRTQDVEPILEANKQAQSEEQRSDWGRKVASIPVVLIERWLLEEHARGNTSLRLFTPEFDQIVARKIRDPDNRFLLTTGKPI